MQRVKARSGVGYLGRGFVGSRNLSTYPTRAWDCRTWDRRAWAYRSLPVVIALLGLFGMPTLSPYVGTGTDPSWSIAMNMAAARHLVFGRQVLFTFGPLGFLASPGLSVPRLGIVSMVFRFFLSMVFGWLVARPLLRSLPVLVVAPATWFLQWSIVGASSGGAETVLIPILLLLLGLGDALVSRRDPLGRLGLLAGGVVISTTMLTKFDSGLLSALIVSLFLVAEAVSHRRQLRQVACSFGWLLAGFVVSLVGWWIVLQQPLSALVRWLSLSRFVFRGYESAMVADATRRYGWVHSLIFVLITLGILIGCAFVSDSRRKGVMQCVLISVGFVVFAKQSFTRYDNGHLQRLYTASAVALVAAVGILQAHRYDPIHPSEEDSASGDGLASVSDLPSGDISCVENGLATRTPGSVAIGRRGYDWRASGLLPLLILGIALYSSWIGAALINPPRPDLWSWRSVARLAASSSQREAVVTRQRTLLPPQLEMSPEIRAALSGGVHVEPTETSVAWIFPEVNWTPLPIFQSYSAYTPELDHLNAEAMQRRSGPDTVLYSGGLRVDFRMARFESPETQVAFVCNFRQRLYSERWQVFARRSDGSGCSAATQFATVKAQLRQEVQLPDFPDDSLVVATFNGLSPTPLERLRSVVFRAPKYWFVLADPDPGEPAHRFVANNAMQPHIVSLPKCLRKAWSGYDTRTFQRFFVRDSEWPSPHKSVGREVQITLRAYRFRCPS
jgi:hypothetical protein